MCPGRILQRIRADAEPASTRVIVATAYLRLAEGLHNEADWILSKPVSFSQMQRVNHPANEAWSAQSQTRREGK